MVVVESKVERMLQRVVDAQFQVPRHSVAPTAISIDSDRFHIPAMHPRGQARGS
jgi:hypothetical protein